MLRLMKIYGLLLLSLLLVACGGGEGEVGETAVPTQEIAAVTDTLEPTETAVLPTDTPEPTETAVPTETIAPTETIIFVETAVSATKQPVTTTASDATATPNKVAPTVQPIVAGDEIDALQLVLDSESRARSLETSQFTQNVSVITVGFEQEIIQNCQIELPDHGYCRTDITIAVNEGDPLETYNETVQNGAQTWLREEGGPWRDITTDLAESETLSQEGLQQLTMSEFMVEAELVGETTIGGVLVYEVAFTLDVNAYVATIFGEELAALFTAGADDNNGSGHTWIGQEDRLVRKALIEMSFVIEGETMSMTTQVASFGFNEPVEIPDPESE